MTDDSKKKIRPSWMCCCRESIGDVYSDRLWPEHPNYWGYEVDEDGNPVDEK